MHSLPSAANCMSCTLAPASCRPAMLLQPLHLTRRCSNARDTHTLRLCHQKCNHLTAVHSFRLAALQKKNFKNHVRMQVSLLSDGATFISSCGDWYEEPYPFFVNASSVVDGTLLVVTAAVPGNVFSTRGTRPQAVFAGQDFATQVTPRLCSHRRLDCQNRRTRLMVAFTLVGHAPAQYTSLVG